MAGRAISSPGGHLVEPHEGVADKRYKLIHFLISDEWELFDLIEDPMEMHSVYDDPRYGEIRRNLESRLEEQKKKFDV